VLNFLVILGVFLIGLSKAGFATGLGVLTTPLITTTMPAQKALGIILPLLSFADLLTIAFYWKKWNPKVIIPVLVGALPGIIVGMFFIRGVDDVLLKKCIGLTTIIFTLLLVVRQVWFPKRVYVPKFWHGLVIGTIAGFTSAISHAAGPIVAIYLIAQKMDKQIFVGTSAIYFTIGNLMKVPPYIVSGILNWQVFMQSLILFPIVPLGVIAGWWANKYLPQKVFTYLVYIFLVITSIKLIIG